MYKNKTIKYQGNAQEIFTKVPFQLFSKRCFKLAVSPAYGPKNKPYSLLIGGK